MPQYNFRSPVQTSPSDVKDNDAFAFKVVAVAYPGGTWRTYRGPSDWSDQMVAEQGDEIHPDAAKLLFYDLANSGRVYG